MKNGNKLGKILAFFGGATSLLLASSAFAEEVAGAAGSHEYWGPVGKGLIMGLAVFGGALGQGKVAAAALEGNARNPQANLLVPFLLGLAFIETLVLFAFLVAGGIH